MHSEDDNEYVELYMHIAKLIEANHDWAVWHPREVNRMDKDDRSWITSENNRGGEGGHKVMLQMETSVLTNGQSLWRWIDNRCDAI